MSSKQDPNQSPKFGYDTDDSSEKQRQNMNRTKKQEKKNLNKNKRSVILAKNAVQRWESTYNKK